MQMLSAELLSQELKEMSAKVIELTRQSQELRQERQASTDATRRRELAALISDNVVQRRAVSENMADVRKRMRAAEQAAERNRARADKRRATEEENENRRFRTPARL